MKNFLYTVVFSMIAFSANAEGFYFGAGLGQSESNQHQYSSLTYTDYDDKDISYKILFGYDYNDRIGVEVVYNDLGQTKTAIDTPLTAKTDVQSVALAGVVKSDPIIIIDFGCNFNIRLMFFNLRLIEISVKNLLKSFNKKIAGVSDVKRSTNSNACNGFRFANPSLLGLFV